MPRRGPREGKRKRTRDPHLPPMTVQEIHALKGPALIQALYARGLKTSGGKDELQKRLMVDEIHMKRLRNELGEDGAETALAAKGYAPLCLSEVDFERRLASGKGLPSAEEILNSDVPTTNKHKRTRDKDLPPLAEEAIHQMSKGELGQALYARGLKRSGKRDELIERLIKDEREHRAAEQRIPLGVQTTGPEQVPSLEEVMEWSEQPTFGEPEIRQVQRKQQDNLEEEFSQVESALIASAQEAQVLVDSMQQAHVVVVPGVTPQVYQKEPVLPFIGGEDEVVEQGAVPSAVRPEEQVVRGMPKSGKSWKKALDHKPVHAMKMAPAAHTSWKKKQALREEKAELKMLKKSIEEQRRIEGKRMKEARAERERAKKEREMRSLVYQEVKPETLKKMSKKQRKQVVNIPLEP